jgi:hypothetical protein
MRTPGGFKGTFALLMLLILAALHFPKLAAAQIWPTIRDVVPECAQSVPNLIWQWRVNARKGSIKKESPLYAMQADDTRDALKFLKQGQRHNKTVVQLYQSCVDATSIQYILLLAASSADGECDLAHTKVNLLAQRSSNPVSLNEAYRIWDVVRPQYPVSQDTTVMEALLKLYEGQRDNAAVLNEYRACFRDRAVDLFNQIKEVITTP